MLRSSVRQVRRFSMMLQVDPHFRLLMQGYHTKKAESVIPLIDRSNYVEKMARRRVRTSAWEEKLLAGLETYKARIGDLLVPQAFVVPPGDLSWPDYLWGYKLGHAVNRTRKWCKVEAKDQLLSVQMVNELDKIGFVQDVTQNKWDSEVLPCLRQYEKLYGDVNVPHYFVVPKGDNAWPEVAWGRKLGLTVVDIRVGKAFASQMVESRAELEKIGFCFTSIPERDWTEKIFPALKVHRQIFGHCIVKQEFKIPSCDPWPTKAWGISLGSTVRDIRLRKAYVKQATRDKKILDSIDFAWYRSEAIWIEQILPSIRLHAQIYKKDSIPRSFVVPSKHPWPKRAWAMKLGSVFGELYRRGTYFRYFGRDAKLLDELGFSLQMSTRAWRIRVEPLLDIYYQHCDGSKEIAEDFIIPSEAPWPKEAWDVRLGLIVARNISNM